MKEIDYEKIRKLENGESYDVMGLSFEDKMKVIKRLEELGNINNLNDNAWKDWHNQHIFDKVWCDGHNLHPRNYFGTNHENNVPIKLPAINYDEVDPKLSTTITWQDLEVAKQSIKCNKYLWLKEYYHKMIEKNKEENKMELKNMNKENIKEGIKKVKQDRATAEALEAERQFKNYINEKERIERARKELDESEKEMQEKYKVLISEEKKINKK